MPFGRATPWNLCRVPSGESTLCTFKNQLSKIWEEGMIQQLRDINIIQWQHEWKPWKQEVKLWRQEWKPWREGWRRILTFDELHLINTYSSYRTSSHESRTGDHGSFADVYMWAHTIQNHSTVWKQSKEFNPQILWISRIRKHRYSSEQVSQMSAI